jgi:hypothetical protein
VTLPDLTPEQPETVAPAPAGDARRQQLVEGGLIAAILVLAGVLGGPELLQSLREGSVDLGAVYYPVLVVAVATLACTRRSGR